jgi:hypothetical protein
VQVEERAEHGRALLAALEIAVLMSLTVPNPLSTR